VTTESTSPDVLAPSAIVVGASAPDRAAAIEQVGAILIAEGVVTDAYVTAMQAREAIVSTYLGNGIALPHGTSEAEAAILRTGIAVVQFPDGVPWGDEPARLVIGLAARSEEHIGVLSRLATVLGDADLCARLAGTTDATEIHTALTAEPEESGGHVNGQVTGDVTKTVRIANPHGLHARPAAVIVEKALDFDAEVTIVAGDRRANAMSITQVIALGASVGDEVTVSATGDDAAAAVETVLAVLLSTDDAS
jgi:phosphotransferase system HPr (HPr) family protein